MTNGLALLVKVENKENRPEVSIQIEPVRPLCQRHNPFDFSTPTTEAAKRRRTALRCVGHVFGIDVRFKSFPAMTTWFRVQSVRGRFAIAPP